MLGSHNAHDRRAQPLLRLRGLADDAVELEMYEDHITCISYRPGFLFRKPVRRSVRYADIRRLIVRPGPHYGTFALDTADGQAMSINLVAVDTVAQAGLLVSERIYRTHVAELDLAAHDHPALIQALTELHDRGLLTDDYFQAKQRELN